MPNALLDDDDDVGMDDDGVDEVDGVVEGGRCEGREGKPEGSYKAGPSLRDRLIWLGGKLPVMPVCYMCYMCYMHCMCSMCYMCYMCYICGVYYMYYKYYMYYMYYICYMLNWNINK